MATEIREWHDADLPWLIALQRRLDPEADVVALRGSVTDASVGHLRLTATDGDQRVGVALLRPGADLDGSDLPVLFLLVDPVHRHRGHARALFDAVEAHVQGAALGADRADDERSLDIARRWGFEEVVPVEEGGPWLVRPAGEQHVKHPN